MKKRKEIAFVIANVIILFTAVMARALNEQVPAGAAVRGEGAAQVVACKVPQVRVPAQAKH